jgi:hypothetical protein
MPTRKKQDQMSPRYLDQLGRESARAFAFVLSAQANFNGIPLPLPDKEVNQHLDTAITELQRQGRLLWSSLTTERRSIFIDAWIDEVNRLGIRR